MSTEQKPDLAAVMLMPEVQAAIAAAAREAATAAVAELAANAPAPMMANPLVSGDTNHEMKNFFSQMALQIAEISDQGTNRKRVAPEILARRAEAHKKLRDLLRTVKEQQLGPEYRVVAKCYFQEQMIEPFRRLNDKTVEAQIILWQGVPNDALRPENQIAEEVYRLWKDSVGSADRISSIPEAPTWVTKGGLVIKGAAPDKAFVAAPIEHDEDLEVMDNNDPNNPTVRILGTVAAPARRNASDTKAGATGRGY